ncbi:MAG: pyridoxal phosphate-dependent aminotransferase [Acidobacteria bacterium]|nr:pyridoxal phosphate-dependent aminotransferase [Acidobacteriota bacterium]
MTKKSKPDIRMITRLVPPSGNLVQGQSEVALHPALVSALSDVINDGLNHYSLFEGVPELRKAVAEKIRRFNKIEVDINRKPYEVIITPGATGALVAIAHTYLTNASMILFEPYYPYHKKILETCNAQADVVELGEDLSLDINQLRKRCRIGKDRKDYPLKAILVCSPTNPTGKVFTREELTAIADCCKEFDLLCISDEVYEHFVLSEQDHISIATLADMRSRTITCNSFSKSWAVSGWRLGYVFGGGELVGPLHNVGNIFYVCTPTPLQHALSRVLMTDENYYVNLRDVYKIKRDILAKALTQVGFTLYDSRSTFYMWARIPERFDDSETLNNFLIEKAKVAGVPGTAFTDGIIGEKYMRFCFAREEAMLTRAAEQIVDALS